MWKQTLSLQPLMDILATVTIRQSSITFLGTVINGLLGAGFYILSARALGPANFGILIVSITVLTLIVDIGSLGTDTALVRFVSKYIRDQKEKAYRFLKLSLIVRFIILLLLAFTGWFLSPFLANVIFQKPILEFPLKLAFIGAGGMLLFSFSTSSLQALQRFWLWSSLQVGTNTLRLLVIGALWYYGNLNIDTGLMIYIILPFIGFAASFLFLPKGFLKTSQAFLVVGEYFHYSKWVALFSFLTAIYARLDIFISARLLPAAEVGFYAAATQLVAIVPQIVMAIGTVIAPKMASMRSKEELLVYLKKSQLFVVLLAVLGIISIPVILYLIPVIYGASYTTAVPKLFIILFSAMLIFLISVPIHSSVLYYFSYPRLFVWVSAGQLAIIGILGWHLISVYGAIGAAFTVLVSAVFNFVVPFVWILIKLARKE